MTAVANVAINVDSRGANKKLDDLGRKAKRTETAFGNLSSVVTKLGGALAGIQAAKFVIAKTSELERQTRSLQVLTGSLEQAKNVIRELQQFGAVTPFTSAELIETAKRLKAFGFETQNIVDVTKRLSDIAGATGADLGGIATAFGQIQAKGRLQGEELLQLQERGVDLQGTLRKEYGLTADEFQKALSKGQIGADAVNHALVELTETGGKYAGGAISQSDTLAGKFSTLQDGIDNIARKIGEVLAPALKSVLDLAIDTVNNINAAFAAGSITDTQKQGFKQLAEEEVKRFAGPLPGGPFGAGEIVVRTNGKTYKGAASSVVSQITNDLINAEIERLTQASAPKISKSNIQTSIPALGAGTNGGTSSSGKSAADELQRRLEAGASIEQQLTREIELRSASTELDRQLLQIQYELEDTLARINESADAGSKARLRNLAEFNAQQQSTEALRESLSHYRESWDELSLVVGDFQEQYGGLLMKQKTDTDRLNEALNQVGQTLGNSLMNVFDALINKTSSFNDILSDTLKQLGSLLIRAGLNSLADLGDPSGQSIGILSFLGFGNKKATGGPVQPNGTYLVGEQGPELLTMGNQSGFVHRNTSEAMDRYRAGGSSGGGIRSLNVNYNVTQINGMNFVTEEQFRAGMTKAAKDGAKMGEAGTFKSMRNSRSSRARVGL